MTVQNVRDALLGVIASIDNLYKVIYKKKSAGRQFSFAITVEFLTALNKTVHSKPILRDLISDASRPQCSSVSE